MRTRVATLCATPDEYGAGIAAARNSLRAKISAVAPRWQSRILESEGEDEEAWSPRTMVQHALVIDLVYSAVLRGGLTGTGTTMRDALALIAEGWEESYPDLGPTQMGLRSADDAVSAIDEQGPRVDQLLASVADRDLQRPQTSGTIMLPPSNRSGTSRVGRWTVCSRSCSGTSRSTPSSWRRDRSRHSAPSVASVDFSEPCSETAQAQQPSAGEGW